MRHHPDRTTDFPDRRALFGGMIWIILVMLVHTGSLPFPAEGFLRTITLLLLFAPLVIVPLGLSLTFRDDVKRSSLHRSIKLLQLPAAVAAAVSFLFDEGMIASLLTLPWLAGTGLIALLAVRRFIGRRKFSLQQTGLDVGMLYIVVGGIWLMISRAGMVPMNFPPVIVLLTAVHFHYAGFAAPIIAGLLGEYILPSQKGKRRLYELALWSVMLNPVLIAVGISISPLLEVLCSALLALGLGLLAGLMPAVVRKLQSGLARILLSISALSLPVTMTLAFLYAWGAYTGRPLIDIPGMAETHGAINVFGFALCGLAGWSVERRVKG